MEPFDLTQDPWLQLRSMQGGQIISVGIADALTNADSFGELVVDLPTQTPALLRQVLLPVVADALGLPKDEEEWAQRFTAGAFLPEEQGKLRSYLADNADRMSLFGDKPFAQVGGLEALSGETKGSGLIVATEATGNNVPLFSARTEAAPPALTSAEAARWLLHAHCWDTAAIKTGAKDDPKAKAGKTTGNPTGPLGQLGVLVPIGKTFYETLILNLPIWHPSKTGIPQWRKPEARPEWDPSYTPTTLLELWTLQSRRIRLIPEETPEGVRVSRVIVAAGDRLHTLPEWEPHTAWKSDKPANKSKPADRKPRRHVPGKAIWRGLDALLAIEQANVEGGSVETSLLLRQAADMRGHAIPDDYPLRVEAFGLVYGNQSAVVEHLYHDLVTLPMATQAEDQDLYGAMIEMSEQAEQLARAVNHLSADLRRASGLEPIPWDKGQRPGEQVLHRLDPAMRRVLSHLPGLDDERIEDVLLAWEKNARRVTDEVAAMVFASVPESVFGPRGAEGDDVRERGLGQATSHFRGRVNRILQRSLGGA
ncbi:type I-E CRISPR-associated protein Cse1/CasA [Actinocorallia populi]|uniref:type I-E CRISPR-associated protein Cse1/CasA n=1 Tax=Actinocorallia populi TaxID=2079200 RepID=UPI000D096D75|nr:type I-E CRISPR-associated protein Cse1/CasA [Actinocorallia populi]